MESDDDTKAIELCSSQSQGSSDIVPDLCHSEDRLLPFKDTVQRGQIINSNLQLGSDGEDVEGSSSASNKSIESKKKRQKNSKCLKWNHQGSELGISLKSGKTLTCDTCGLEYASKRSLRIHLKNSTSCSKDGVDQEHLAPYECTQCNKTFQSISFLTNHSCCQSPHLFQCNICSHVFDNPMTLSHHIAQHDIPKPFQCGLCGAKFHENVLLLEHLRKCDKDIRCWYKCQACLLNFSNVSELGDHVKVYHSKMNKPYRCRICLKEFSKLSKKQFSRHVKSHKSRDHCEPQRNQTRSSALRAPKKFDKRKVVPVACEVINKKQHGELTLKVKLAKTLHVEEQSDDDPVQSFENHEDELSEKENVGQTHSGLDKAGDKNFDCDECGVRFNSMQELRNHREFHPSKDIYTVDCDKCKKTFVSLNLLKAHLHENDCEGYRCSQCPESFALEALLLVHEARSHIEQGDDKLLTCHLCSKTFPSMLKYSRHAGTHATSKPFLCKQCNHRYVHPDHLFAHLKKTHDINKEKCLRKRVTCKICSTEFVDDAALTAHHKYHTVEETSNLNVLFETKESIEMETVEEGDKRNEHFDCNVCGDRLLDIKEFVKHRNDHFFNNRFIIHCQSCKETFSDVADIKKHVKAKKCPGFKCSKCKKSFGLQTTLFSHEAKEHSHDAVNSGKYECHKCLKPFENRIAFIRHAATHAHIKSFQCGQCNSLYTTLEYVQTHIRLSHKPAIDGLGFEFDCESCSMSFQTHEALVNHKKHCPEYKIDQTKNDKEESQVGSYFSCNSCPKIFWGYNAKVKHMKSHLKPFLKKKKSLTCTICEKKFRENYELQRHVGTHTRPYLCSSCGKSFSLPWSLREHMKAHHSKDNPYRCEFCNKNYSTSNSLRLHRRIHTGEKNFQCEHCDKIFVDMSYLKSHIKSHFPDKPYKCTICSYSSKHKSGLSRHMTSHRQEKNHLCPICNKAFTQKGHVKTHMKLHSKVKNHVCNVCGNAFARSDYLKIHMRTHTNEKPYSCPVCDRPFAMSSNMLSHIKKTHPDYKYQYKHLRVNYEKPSQNISIPMSSQPPVEMGNTEAVAPTIVENGPVVEMVSVHHQSSSNVTVVEKSHQEQQPQHGEQQMSIMQPMTEISNSVYAEANLFRQMPQSVPETIYRHPDPAQDVVRQRVMDNSIANFAGLGNNRGIHGEGMVRHSSNMPGHANMMMRPPEDVVRESSNAMGNDLHRLGGDMMRGNPPDMRQAGFIPPGQEYMYVYPNFPQGPYMQDFIQPYSKP